MAKNASFSKKNLPSPQYDSGVGDPSLGETSSYIKSALSGFIAARIELASLEAKEVAGYAAKKTTHGVILAGCLFFTWALILAGLTGVLAPIVSEWLVGKMNWLPGWVAVLFGLSILHGIAALIFLILLKKKPSSPFFELSRMEIEHDKQWLKKNK